MKRSVLVLASILALSSPAFSDPVPHKPTFGVRAAEGYVLLLKDGGTSGPVNTRFDVTLGLPVTQRLALGFGVGAVIPNDAFRPSVRFLAGISLKLIGDWSLAIAPCYQYNPQYSGKPDSHFIGLGFGPSYQIGRVSIGLATGPGWTSRVRAWSWVLQPSVGFSF